MLSLLTSTALASTVNAYYTAIGSHSTDWRVHQRQVTINSDGKLGFNASALFKFSLADDGTLTGINDQLSGNLALQPDYTLRVQPTSDDHFTLNKTLLEVNLHSNFVACIDDSLIYFTGEDGSVLPDCKVTTGVGIIGLSQDGDNYSNTVGFTGKTTSAEPAASTP